MATSAVEICNLALALLGEAGIVSLAQANSEPARLCNLNYAAVRDELLRAQPWNFALTRRSLPRLAAAPTFGFRNAFALPSEPFCLRAVRLWAGAGWSGDFRIEGRDLLADCDQADLLYIARIEVPALFDPIFVQCLAHRLAQRVAYPLTRNRDLTRRLGFDADRLMAEAAAVDGVETVVDPLPASPLVAIRG